MFMSGQFLDVDVSSQERQLKPQPGQGCCSVDGLLFVYVSPPEPEQTKNWESVHLCLLKSFLPTFLPSKTAVSQQCLAVESPYPRLSVRPRMRFQRSKTL